MTSRCGRSIAVSIAVAAIGPAGAHAQTLSLNLPEALADTKASLAAGGVTSIVVIGDSLSFRPGTWIYEFRALMQQAYGDAGPGYQAFSWWTGAGTTEGWTMGTIGQDTPPHHGLDGLWVSSAPGPATVGNPARAFQIVQGAHIATHLIAGPDGGGVQITYPDSGATLLTTLAPANDVLVVAREVPGAGSQVWFQPLGKGKVTILGHNNLTGTPGVVIHRAANGGWGVRNYLQRDWTFDRQLQILAPALVMIWLGQNDQGYGREAYAALISSLVDRLGATVSDAEIVLIGTFDAGGTAIPVLVSAMEDVARERSIGFMNMHAAGGPRAFLQENGYLEEGHFSRPGGAYFGGLVFDAFQNEEVAPFCGASVVEHPQEAAVDVGAPAWFRVGAAATAEMSYRWRRNGQPLHDDGRIMGAGTTRLTIAQTAGADTAIYDAVVTTACGSVVSAGAPLTVRVPCNPDLNHDGFLDGIDSDLFSNAFEAGDPAADYNADGFVDGIDYDLFMIDFEVGC